MPKAPTCRRCGSQDVCKNGSIISPLGRVQRYVCKACGKFFHPPLREVPRRDRVEAFFDIEASSLTANFGHMISWAMKFKGGDTRSDYIKRRTLSEERRVLRSLLRELKQVDVLYTYYGTRFDIPFVRTRCLHHGLEFPRYLDLYHVDVYFIARRHLRLHSTRLEAVAEALGVGRKTHVDPKVWSAASFGDKDAIRAIWRHNLKDVEILERVYEVLGPYARPVYRSI